MAEFPSVFTEFIVNLVKVGEETGNLDIALIRAADYYDCGYYHHKGRIKGCAFYLVFYKSHLYTLLHNQNKSSYISPIT